MKPNFNIHRIIVIIFSICLALSNSTFLQSQAKAESKSKSKAKLESKNMLTVDSILSEKNMSKFKEMFSNEKVEAMVKTTDEIAQKLQKEMKEYEQVKSKKEKEKKKNFFQEQLEKTELALIEKNSRISSLPENINEKLNEYKLTW